MAVKMQLFSIDISRDFYAHIENGSYNVCTSKLLAFRRVFKCSVYNFCEARITVMVAYRHHHSYLLGVLCTYFLCAKRSGVF